MACPGCDDGQVPHTYDSGCMRQGERRQKSLKKKQLKKKKKGKR